MGPRVPTSWRSRLQAIVAAWPGPRLARSMRRLAEIGAAPASEPFDTPSVVLHAKDDASVPLPLGEALAALGSRTKLVVLEDGGHCLPLTEPDLVASLAFARDP